MSDIARALVDTLIARDPTLRSENVADGLFAIASALERVATALRDISNDCEHAGVDIERGLQSVANALNHMADE